ncbi:hypothetical protein A2334_03495 [Candidatus Roizmanbacteria bacterium RIFOXYB2_FULL_38_10]|uniref:Uncharacterized protein n=1 Tax=Candidatus Roizmanbacteria bacterium RIFOXYD1_FULL_38_12 TaxID=1802093 RepID=A0A1F7L0Y9_9BACT|nr:MAG: hypothetical protein A3K47_03350 [Candidatus Roizmanbacteria bacterium RIFOXYA2_FULL_38_14]OGK63800.1 MAG: hypothetical protein A3K27_03350 [Candidatus Roizmanbacteria bacterium RIFOXYA1_FULL_37_12]OGK65646.1 MAG: hypothetical protein A3K38_03350 [Candidatus Roizmanbacteria bacterium RIFOXYB1_FULL_40_23]OGK67466.1 MAG: hypothetical protein A2334_03495 [Candidatus Roizmanbacteria bacterium RIFOXYB2_FULL_38_10]OGK70051.1 MAG: hypothetical protein A3K21_03355 [Candidatus Roizmanbacteria ba
MENKIKEKVDEIHEGIQNLKGRTNFSILLHKDRLWEVETGINKYREHNQIEGLRHAIQAFHETAILSREGAAAYNETIWDANVQVRGKMTVLDQLFHDLEMLVLEFYKN